MPQTKNRYFQIHQKFVKKHREKAKNLREKHQTAWEFLTKTKVPLDQLGQHTARFAAAGALSAALTFTPALLPAPAKTPNQVTPQTLALTTTSIIPQSLSPLSSLSNLTTTEITDNLLDQTASFLSQKFGLTVTTTIDDIKLPVYLGWIGAEQHLQRFPGDVVSLHDEFQSSGIAPHVGAWGFFSSAPSKLTDDLKLKEEYYVAIQTFNLPQWEKNWPKLKEWFKYRKVMVINPENEKVVVAVVADAGPADWTGKQMGGSPEVMDRLGLTHGFRKGKVLMFFVDDPRDEVPLGEIKNESF